MYNKKSGDNDLTLSLFQFFGLNKTADILQHQMNINAAILFH